MELNKLNYDIEKLIKFLKAEDKELSCSPITPFRDTGNVYIWTNEKMSLYPKENLENKKVLTITSSGDHILEAILNDAKEIDSIDINIFCKYYSALKIAMIKKYDYDEFIEKMNLITREFPVPYEFFYNILNNINKCLTDEEFKFWNTYLQYKSEFVFTPDFFCPFSRDFKRNKYSFKEIYYNLKDKIDDVKINYYDIDIINAPKVFVDNKYDYIYLSNIVERIRSIDVRNQLLEQLTDILNNNATIYNFFNGMYNTKLKDVFGQCPKMLNDKFNFEFYYDYDDGYMCEKDERGLIQMTLK